MQERDRPFTGEDRNNQEQADQQQDRSRYPDIIHHHLRQIISVLSPQINKRIFISADKDKSKEQRSPYQHGRTEQETFQQRYPAQVH